MQKAVLAPDSFKGVLSAKEVCDIMAYRINKYYPFCEIVKVPVADGGAGSIDAFLCCKEGKKIFVNALNADMQMTKCYFMVYENTAVIETSQLMSVYCGTRGKYGASSYGVGQLVMQALRFNVSRIILCLGQNVLTDCGCGMAAALGAKFFDASYKEFVPDFLRLGNVVTIDLSQMRKNLSMTNVVALTGENYPVSGGNGLVARLRDKNVLQSEDVQAAENSLNAFCDFLKRNFGRDYREYAGTGASFGLGLGAMTFFDATISRGIDTVLDIVNFGGLIKDADVIFTGEGSLDVNSVYGNVLNAVCRYARRQNVPVVDIVGKIGNVDRARLAADGVAAIFALNNDIFVKNPHESTSLALAAFMDELIGFWQIKHARANGGLF